MLKLTPSLDQYYWQAKNGSDGDDSEMHSYIQKSSAGTLASRCIL